MEYSKDTDNLLAEKPTIPENTIFEILLDCPFSTLSALETRLGIKKITDRKETAKQLVLQDLIKQECASSRRKEKDAWRKQFGISKGETTTKKNTKKENQKKTKSKDLKKQMNDRLFALAKETEPSLIAFEAYIILKGWMKIKFSSAEEYLVVEFFDWVRSFDVLKKLETRVKDFKSLPRAHEFLSYINEVHNKAEGTKREPTSEAKSMKKEHSKRGRPAFPYSDRFESEVKKLDEKGVRKKDIPYRESITKLLNPDAPNQGRVIDEEKYKRIYRHAYSTVYGYAAKAIKENKKKKQKKQ